MLLKWFVDCQSEDDKRRRKELVSSNKNLLDILSKICYNSIVELESPLGFDQPDWALRMADRQGQLKTLRQIRDLCNLDKGH